MYAPYALEVVVRSRLEEEARRAVRDRLLRRPRPEAPRRLGPSVKRVRLH